MTYTEWTAIAWYIAKTTEALLIINSNWGRHFLHIIGWPIFILLILYRLYNGKFEPNGPNWDGLNDDNVKNELDTNSRAKFIMLYSKTTAWVFYNQSTRTICGLTYEKKDDSLFAYVMHRILDWMFSEGHTECAYKYYLKGLNND